MRKILASFVLVCGVAGLVQAQTPKDASQALPEKFGDWSRSDCTYKIASVGLAGERSAAGSGSSCQYSLGDKRISVLVQQFRDPSSAYEAYTSGLKPGMLPSFVGSNAALDGQRLRLLSGNLVVSVESQQLVSEADLR